MPVQNLARRIDHLVLAARDLEALAQLFRHLGFVVGARNRHPWGTQNHIVQFDGAFIELIAAEPGFHLAADADPQRFSFAGFIGSFLEERQGGAMIAMTSDDAEADARAFAVKGLGEFEPFHFARRGKKPDGSAMEVAFTLAFARSRLLPDIGFFACQHHFPQNFWDKSFQQHSNGAGRLEGLVLVAENPADHGEFISNFCAVRNYTPSSTGLRFVLCNEPMAYIDVLTPLAFRQKYGAAALPSDPETPVIAGCVIGIDDRAALTAALEGSRTEFEQRDAALVIGPDVAFGISLIFQVK